MASLKYLSVLLLALLGTVLCAQAAAQVGDRQPARFSEPSYLDRQYMAQQRELIEDVVRRHMGRQFNGLREHDLQLLQEVLDRGLVRPEQTRELQAMGIIMGELLAAELGLHWVIYQDRVGRSRALRYRDTDTVLFPITMISRRVEVGNDRPVAEIYRKAYDIIDEIRPPRPYDVRPPASYP